MGKKKTKDGISKYQKKINAVKDDMDLIKKYLFDKKNGSCCYGCEAKTGDNKCKCEKLVNSMEKYMSAIVNDKKNMNENKNADIASIASSVEKFYMALQRKKDLHSRTDLTELRTKISDNVIKYFSGSMKVIKEKTDQLSKNSFITWLFVRLTIHRSPTTKINSFSKELKDIANGVNMNVHLYKLLESQPNLYTKDIADAIGDMVDRFAKEKTTEDIPINKYLNVLNDEDVTIFNRIAERVRNYGEKNKPFDTKQLYKWSDKTRQDLTILLANIIALIYDPNFKNGMTPQEIRSSMDENIRFLRKLFARKAQQVEQRIMTTTITPNQQETDFSAFEWQALKTNIRKKKQLKLSKKRQSQTPTLSLQLRSDTLMPPLQSKTPTLSLMPPLQSKTPSLSLMQPLQSQTQTPQIMAQKKMPAKPKTFKQWFQNAPIIQSTVVVNPKHGSLRQRKQANIQILRDNVSETARMVLENALVSGADSIFLIDVRNLGTKRHPDKSFQQKFQSLLRQSDVLIREQSNLGQTISRPFFVFVDQGDLTDGPIKVDIINDRSVRIRASCVKETERGLTDCHYAQGQQQRADERKNPMDDYVLLSLYYILSEYYDEYVKASGGVEEEMEEIRQFMRRNPGVARYSPEMVRQFRERIAQLGQINKKIVKDAPRPYILSDDLYRDWLKK